jgi:hypothetical protein
MNQRHNIKVIAIAGACLSAALAIFWIHSNHTFPFPHSRITFSETGTAVYFPEFYEACPVGRTPDDLKALGKITQVRAMVYSSSGTYHAGASTPYKPIDLDELKNSGRIFFIRQRTQIGVISNSDGLMKVKILSGVNKDREGWISASAFRSPGEPDTPASKPSQNPNATDIILRNRQGG